MANALICDKCGEVFKEGEFKLLGEMHITDRDKKLLDLCYSCTEKLEDWYSLPLKDFIKKYKK